MSTKIFYNGKILTVDQKDRVAEAIAIHGNIILAVGTNEEIMNYKDKNSEIIDLKGKCIVPGFIDAHQHIGMQGFNKLSVDCSQSNVESIEDILKKIQETAKRTPKGEWIRGWGYNESNLSEGRHPERFELDKVAPDNPVMLIRVCGHVSTNNTKALAVAGITDDTPSQLGGEIVHNSNGQVTGVLKESAHYRLLGFALPEEDELLKSMAQVTDLLVSKGITSVHEAGAYGPISMRLFQRGTENGMLKTRIYATIFSFVENEKFIDRYSEAGVYTGLGNEKFRIGAVKLMIDGSSSAPTAAMIEPFCGRPKDRGILCYSQEEVDQIIIKAHKAGYQVTSHAVGDRAITVIVNAIEKALRLYPRANHRHRIEHCAFVNDELIARIKELGIIPIAQPGFLYDFGEGYMKNYGKKRVDKMFPCKTWFKNNITVAGSSDCPVTKPDPLFGMYAAVNRITNKETAISQEERISIKQALRMYTINGAYASFEEHIKGSLEAGKLADLVILTESPYDVKPEEIKDITIERTIIDGITVYQKN